MKRFKGAYLFVLLVAIALLAACGEEEGNKAYGSGLAEGEIIQLTVADSLATSNDLSSQGMMYWMNRVEELSEGRVQFTHYPAEQLGKAKSMLDYAKTGVADVTYIGVGYVSEKMPLSGVGELPGAADSSTKATKAYWQVVQDVLYEEEYVKNKIKPLFAVVLPPYKVMTTKDPVVSTKDIKGLKLRSGGGTQSFVLNKLGATPVTMSAPDTYTALERGTIDGVIFPSTSVKPYQLETIVDYIETYIATTVIPLYNQIAAMFNNLDTEQQDTILKNIQNIGESITTGVSGFIQAFLKNIPTIIGWFPTTATALLFTLLGTFFISKDWDTFGRMTGKVLPDKIFAGAKRLFRDLKRALFGFIRAQFTLVSLTTVTILIGFLILGVNYSITIALICGLVDIIPYLGTGTIFIPWIIFEFIAGNTSLAIGLSVLYIIVVVQRQLIEPKVLSSSIGLDPLATLIALFIGFKLIGFLGLIAGPVVLVIFNTLQRAHVFKAIWTFIIGDTKKTT